MIHFANDCDFSQIIALWKECFPDNNEFFDWYFANQYHAENTLVYECDGIISAILQRLPYQIKNIGQVSYIYGACTHPNYRRKGIMAELIKYSAEIDLSLDIIASILIPREESLFQYYKNFGYKAAFRIYHKTYQKQNLPLNLYNFRECTKNDIPTINHLYESVLGNSNYVLRDSNYWKKQITMFLDLGGDVFCLEHDDTILAYAFVWNDSPVYIQELLGINDEVNQILCSAILEHNNLEAIEATLLTDNSQGEDFGCINLYNSEICNTDLPFVMNLMFD